MQLISIIQLAALAPIAFGMPTSDVSTELAQLERRVDMPENPRVSVGDDDCFRTEFNAEGKKSTDCKPKQALEKDGSCKVSLDSKEKCQSYCEQSLAWSYGKEIPFVNGACRKGELCTLTDTMTTSKGKTWGFTLGITQGAFSAGASVLFSEEKSYASGFMRGKPEELKNDCGYWTFIPYLITSCGTTGKAEHKRRPGLSTYQCKNLVSTPDQCATTYLKTGQVTAGTPVFVATNCETNKRLAFCKQDPLYLRLGVSDDDDLHRQWVAAHTDGDVSKPLLTTPDYWCKKTGKWINDLTDEDIKKVTGK